jgi:uncharacterized protein YuzE
MYMTYSPDVDAAYVYFRPIESGEVTQQHVVKLTTLRSQHDLVFDLTTNGELVGFEVLDASLLFSQPVLNDARRPG